MLSTAGECEESEPGLSSSPASISISESNRIPIISFTGTLESSETMDGPWTKLTGATSPYAVVADRPAQFFRAR